MGNEFEDDEIFIQNLISSSENIDFFCNRCPHPLDFLKKTKSNAANVPQDSFCISGAVQSDTYYNMVNIPFAIDLKKEKDTISLRKGDPFVQVVPFLREKVKIIQEKADLNELGTVIEKIEKNTNFYKDQIKIKY